MEQLSKIESYILGELKGTELAAFQEAMRQDPDLEKEIQRQGELMARLEAMRLRERVRLHKVSQRPQRRNVIPIWIRAVAAVTILGIVMFWIDRNSERHSADQAQQKDMPASDSMVAPMEEKGTQIRVDERPVAEAPDSVKKSSKILASAEWKSIFHEEVDRLEIPEPGFMGADPSVKDLSDNFRKAHRAMRSENTSEALRIMAEMERVAPEWYEDDLEWMRALCLLLQHPERGKRELQLIANDPSHEHRIRALQIMGKLER